MTIKNIITFSWKFRHDACNPTGLKRSGKQKAWYYGRSAWLYGRGFVTQKSSTASCEFVETDGKTSRICFVCLLDVRSTSIDQNCLVYEAILSTNQLYAVLEPEAPKRQFLGHEGHFMARNCCFLRIGVLLILKRLSSTLGDLPSWIISFSFPSFLILTTPKG